MDDMAVFFADEDMPRARVALLLKHFSKLETSASRGGSSIPWPRFSCC